MTSSPKVDARTSRRRSSRGSENDRQLNAREWLRANGHDDVADLIDEIMRGWAEKGNRTRRNWWDLLAGDSKGRPRFAAGVELPVLAAAQKRMGRPVTKNARTLGTRASIPPIRRDGRWPEQGS